jgi:hypothetical protein
MDHLWPSPRRRRSPLGLPKLMQIAIELRFQAVTPESTECLEH